MFSSPKANKKRTGAQLNISDSNLACDEENYGGARFVRRARSFKNDFLDKLTALRAVNNASFRLNRTASQKSKSNRFRVHSETELKTEQDENESVCDIRTISNQLSIALKYFQVAAKTKTEMLPGNGTVILEILISLKLFLASKIGFDKSASVTSAKNFMYQSACDLIKICDQILLEGLNETFCLNHECVLESVRQLNTAVQTLIEIANRKSVKSTTDLEVLENTDRIKVSSIDVPLTNREKEYLDVSFLSNYSNNYANQSIFKNFEISTPSLPPKPSLTSMRSTVSLSSSSQNDSFVSDNLDSMNSILADFEPEYRQFENVNSNETLSDTTTTTNSIENRVSNSESGIADSIGMPNLSISSLSNNYNLSWSFASAKYSYTSSNSTISFHEKQNAISYISSNFSKNCSSLPPNLPPKQSSIKRQPSPYDNLLNSVEQNDEFSNRYQNFEHDFNSSPDLQKPPPLPVKKKHIMVYMEMIGNCSHTSITNIESRFDKIFVEKSQSNQIVEDIKPPALPPKKGKLKPVVTLKTFEPSNQSLLTWNNNDIREVNKEQTHVKCPDLYELEFLDIENIFVKYLLRRNKNEEGPEIKAGYLESLVFLATKNLNNDSSYQDAFLTTYRTFLSPLDLIKMLIKQYQSLSCQLDREFRLRDLLALLSKLIDNLIVTDLNNELLTTVTEFIHLLICNGDLIQAKILRISLIEKCNRKELFRFQMNLPSSLTLNIENYSLLDFKSEQLAEQMTLLDANLFEKIEIPEVLIWAQEQNEERSPNLTKFTEHFNKMSYWVRSRILERNDAKEREKYVSKFIKIMKYLRKINNFNSYLAILSALDSAPVRRLEWQKQITEGLKEYCALIDSSSSFRAYRQALSETQPPCIPYIGLVLQDLTFIHTGNCDYLSNGMVNFSKRWQQYNVVENLQKFKKGLYVFKKNDRILSFLNNFDNFICEEAMWHISESIKPRTCKKSTLTAT